MATKKKRASGPNAMIRVWNDGDIDIDVDGDPVVIDNYNAEVVMTGPARRLGYRAYGITDGNCSQFARVTGIMLKPGEEALFRLQRVRKVAKAKK